ncbi:MAG: hypothetical protein ACJAW3_000672 [Lentimonas sp.]|jgi:hypothetical protein
MRVKIYQPSAAITQSVNKTKSWLLIADEIENKSISSLTGWTSSDNTLAQLKLKFNDLETAKSYADSQGWDYFIVKAKESIFNKKSYTDNFLK